jgi:protein tyrosine/serine phosphatase
MAPPTRSTNQDAMMQMLQMMMADREAEELNDKPILQHCSK